MRAAYPNKGESVKAKVMRIAILLAATTLAGCTTVDDFRKMSAQDRATRVCDRDPTVRSLRASRQSYLAGIQSAQEALGRGYRIHRQCQMVDVPTGKQSICEKRGEQTICKEASTTRKEERCKETPVAIQADNERRNVAEWSAAVAGLDTQIRGSYDLCYDRVFHMTPEQAFKLY